jgi:hypothetical protein
MVAAVTPLRVHLNRLDDVLRNGRRRRGNVVARMRACGLRADAKRDEQGDKG